MLMSKVEWEAWLQLPVTKELFSYLKEWDEELKDRWANGNFTAETYDKTIQLNSQAIGIHKTLESLLNITYEDLVNNE